MSKRRRRKNSRPKTQKTHLIPAQIEAAAPPIEAPAAHRRPRWTRTDIWVVKQYAAFDAPNLFDGTTPTLREIATHLRRSEHSVRAKLRELTGTSSRHSTPGQSSTDAPSRP